jgi:hypothetical protein
VQLLQLYFSQAVPAQVKSLIMQILYKRKKFYEYLHIFAVLRMLGLPDPNPLLVRGMDPDPSLFAERCLADWNIACKIKL